jgi:hypothetical protein
MKDNSTALQSTTNPILGVVNMLLDHPRFDYAALYYFENVSKWKQEIGFFNKFISGNTRLLILYYICYLHFKNQSGLPENGATFAKVWDHVNSRKLMGSRALRTILGILVRAGYLRKAQGEFDQRIFALIPTESLLSSMQIHVANTVKCLDLIFEIEDWHQTSANDPEFLKKSIVQICDAVKKNKSIFSNVDPLLREIVMTKGGLETLFEISCSDLKNQRLPQPYTIAKLTMTSASQIHAILVRLTEAGALDLDLLTNENKQSKCTKLAKIFLARELALYLNYVSGVNDSLVATAKV